LPFGFRKGDAFLIAAVIIAACALSIAGPPRQSADRAIISVDGAIWKTVALGADDKIIYDSGDRKSIIAVKDGRIYIEESSCPDKLCVRQGALKDAGSVVVCLPNRLSVRLVHTNATNEKYGGVDAISGGN
jgi:hypothetical protein